MLEMQSRKNPEEAPRSGDRNRPFVWSLLPLLAIALSLAAVLAACGQSSSDEVADDVAGSDSDEPVEDESASDDGSAGDSNETATADSESSTTSESTTSTTAEAEESEETTTTAVLTSTTKAVASTSQTVPGGGDEPDYDPGLKPLVDQARSDLAGRLDVGVDAVTLVLAEFRTWPDSSNGCPIEGMQYLQVVTDGAEFIFNAGGAQYRYTTGGEVYTPQLCES